MSTILVIEDDELFREMIAMALEEAGFETLEAEQGGAGVELAKTRRPDVVVSDVQMKQMDGYSVLAALRADPDTATIPVILMTGLPHREGMREGMSLGADDYLTKPFAVADLLAAVRARLEKQQVIRRLAEEKLEALRASISMALPHELRTPLTSILSGAEMIMEHGADMDRAEIQEISGLIHSAGLRLSRLVENFLIYAQLDMLARDAGQVALLQQGRTFNPQTVLRQAAQKQAEARGRSADLALKLVNLPVAISDVYLEKIVDELLDNAFKFSAAGTAVSLETHPAGDDLLLRVADRGRGMDAQQVEDIGAYMQFERKMHEQQGTGLGLQIVKQLTQLHNCPLRIASEPEKGTTVEVLLKGRAGAPGRR